MSRFQKLFSNSLPAIIGMIHVPGLPGTPNYAAGSFKRILDFVLKEADIYLQSGVDGLMIENMHDIPYLNRNVGPEITASMSVIAQEVKKMADQIPCGLQILAGCNKEALAVAKVAGMEFIRAEGFVFSHVADEGLMNADAGELLRYRKSIDAEDVLVLTDIKKKHSSHAITGDLDLADISHAAEFFMSDGIILTGSATGMPADVAQLHDVLSSCDLPVLIGSGVTIDNYRQFKNAHGIIVGSYFKDGGYWKNSLSLERIRNFMVHVKEHRGC